MDSRGSRADHKDDPESDKKQTRGAARWIVGGPVALFFWFGDRALREIWHFSFFASLVIWSGVLGAVLIAGLIYAHVRG